MRIRKNNLFKKCIFICSIITVFIILLSNFEIINYRIKSNKNNNDSGSNSSSSINNNSSNKNTNNNNIKYKYLYELDNIVYNFTEGESKNRGYCRRNDIILNGGGGSGSGGGVKNNKNIKNTLNEDTKIIDNYKKLSFKQLKNSIYFKYQTTVYGKEKNTKDAFECKTLDGKIKYVVLEPTFKGQTQALDIYFDTYSDISLAKPIEPPSSAIPRVLYAFEPPHLRYCSENIKCINKFNWTISYDENADLRLGFDRVDSTPFQTYQKISPKSIMKNKLQFRKEYLDKKKKGKLLPHQHKGVPVASWFCSNCNETFTTRTEIVRDLIELVSIDSYGACLNNIPKTDKLSRLQQDAFFQKKQIISQYKFYLAFENSNCLDYITEKALHALEVGTVPIYLGHPQTLKYLPKGSFIYIGDFNSTRQLANYLKYLDINDQEYMNYHTWRTNQTIIDEWRYQNQYPFKPASNKLMCSLMRKYEQWSTGKIVDNLINSTYTRSEFCLDPYHYDSMLIKSVKPTEPPTIEPPTIEPLIIESSTNGQPIIIPKTNYNNNSYKNKYNNNNGKYSKGKDNDDDSSLGSNNDNDKNESSAKKISNISTVKSVKNNNKEGFNNSGGDEILI